MRFLDFALLLNITAPASAVLPTVFGLELGQPIALPVCPYKRFPDGRSMAPAYERAPAETCHIPETPLLDAPWPRGSLVFPLAKMPTILGDNTAWTFVIGGKLEGLEFVTLSHNNTAAIIRELTAKFGKPTSVDADTSVVSGIQVPSVTATWKLPGLLVIYENIDQDMSYGRLSIETPVLQAMRQAHQRAAERNRTPL